MAEQSWPHPDGPITDTTQWRAAARLWRDTGVIVADDDQLQVEAVAEELEVRVRDGQAWVDGHYYRNTSPAVLPITTADLSNPRIDRVVVEYADNRDPDPAGAVLRVLEGTPAASPEPPALTQTDGLYQLPLAQVLVPTAASDIQPGNITDERVFSAPLHVQFVDDTTQRDAIPLDSRTAVWRRDIEQFEAWDRDNGQWVPSPLGHQHDLDSLTDVDTSGAQDGDALVFDSGSSEWVPAPAGAWQHIATASGTTITFDNIPQTYRHLKLVGVLVPDLSGIARLRINNLAGATAYNWSQIGGGSSDLFANSDSQDDAILISSENGAIALEITIANYTQWPVVSGQRYDGSRNIVLFGGGLNGLLTAVTRLDLFGDLASTSEVSLYGLA